MAKGKDYKPLTSAEQRALRDQKFAAQVSETERAKAREIALVNTLGKFGDECRWFVANRVWELLGYGTFYAWWTERITPVIDEMGLQPGPEMSQLAIETIKKEQESLPSAQRLSQRAIAATVGASDWKVRGRVETRKRRTAADVDLAGRPVLDDVEFTDTTDTSAVTPAEGEADGSELGGFGPESSGPVDADPAGPDIPEDSPAVEPGLNDLDEVEQYPCEKCGGEIQRDQRAVGYARCDACDPDGEHFRPELDGGGRGPCDRCTTDSSPDTSESGEAPAGHPLEDSLEGAAVATPQPGADITPVDALTSTTPGGEPEEGLAQPSSGAPDFDDPAAVFVRRQIAEHDRFMADFVAFVEDLGVGELNKLRQLHAERGHILAL